MGRSPDTLSIREELAACETAEQTAERNRELREVIERIEWFAPVSRDAGIFDYPTGKSGRRASFYRLSDRVLISVQDRRAPIKALQLMNLSEETPIAYHGDRFEDAEALRSRRISVSDLEEMADWLETNAQATRATVRT